MSKIRPRILPLGTCVVAACLLVGPVSAANAAPTHARDNAATTNQTGWTAVSTATGAVYSPSANSASSSQSIARAVHPDYNPITIGECNIGQTGVEVTSYSSTKDGTVKLLCGYDNDGKGSGYIHIREQHEDDWQKLLNTYPIGGNWDDFMDYANKQSFSHPKSGYPTTRSSNNTHCYTTPIQIKNPDGVVVKTINPSVIASINNKIVITSVPTTTTNCADS